MNEGRARVEPSKGRCAEKGKDIELAVQGKNPDVSESPASRAWTDAAMAHFRRPRSGVRDTFGAGRPKDDAHEPANPRVFRLT